MNGFTGDGATHKRLEMKVSTSQGKIRAVLYFCKGGKFLKKLWCCVGGEYNKTIWFYQLG